MHLGDKVVIGQEVVCPDGLGRVMRVGGDYIWVKTYVNNRSCSWSLGNVDLVEIRYVDKEERA